MEPQYNLGVSTLSDLEGVFLNSKPAHILVQLNHPGKDHYTSEIAHQTGCTYSHAVRVIQKLEENGLIKTHKEGRKKVVELTPKGKEIVKPLSELMHALQET